MQSEKNLEFSSLIGNVYDVQKSFEESFKDLKSDRLVFVTSPNPYWGIFFKNHKYPLIFLKFIKQMLVLSGSEIETFGYKLIPPIKIPLVNFLLDNTISRLAFIKSFLPIQYVVAKAKPNIDVKNFSVSIVIPCHNEEDNVADCIKQVPKLGKFTEIIVVDDGSTDKTAQKALVLKKKYPRLKVISYKQNKGKAFAVKTGFDDAKGDILMIWDADRTVPAEELYRFYNCLASGIAQFANGTRLAYPMEKEAMKTLNFLGNIFFGKVYSFILGSEITDTLCGTKALFKKDFKKMEFGTEPWGDFDLLFGATKLGLKIKEVPVHYKARVAGRSKMKTLRYGFIVAKMSLKGLYLFKIKPFFNQFTKNNRKLLIVILLIAAIVRFLGLTPNIPYHPDEGYTQNISQALVNNIINKGDFEPHGYKYGSLIFYLQALVYLPFLILSFFIEKFQLLTLTSDFHKLTFYDSFAKTSYNYREAIYWSQRAITAIFGIASVFITYLIGKKLFNRWVGLFSAIILALAPLHVRDSHYITTDIPSLFFILLSLLFMINLFQTSKWRWYILAGFFAGLSSTIRYFPIVLIIFPLAFLYDPQKNKSWFLKIGLAIFFIPVGAIIGVPFLPFSKASQKLFSSEMTNLVLPFYGTSISAYATSLTGFIFSFGKTSLPPLSSLTPGRFLPYHTSFILFTGFGIIPTIVSLFGIFLGLFSYPRKVFFLLITPIIIFIYISFYMHAVYQRLSIPILPFLSLFIGIFLFQFWKFLSYLKITKVVLIAIFLAIFMGVLYYPLTQSFSLSYACSKESVYKQAQYWIDKNVDVNARLSYQSGLPFPVKPFVNHKEAFRPDGNFFLEEIRNMGSEYAFFNPLSIIDYFNYTYSNDFFTPPEALYKNSVVALANYEYQARAILLDKIDKNKLCEATEFYFYKLPEKYPTAKKILGKFSFDNLSGLNFWHLQEFGTAGTKVTMLLNSGEGKEKKGSLEYHWININYTAPRIVSEKIPVQENQVYTFTGWAKSSQDLDSNHRDGFLRIDFYSSQNDPILLPGKLVALSPRIYGKSDWKKLEITTKSPKDAVFATISLQISGSKGSGSFYFDDLELLEGLQ